MQKKKKEEQKGKVGVERKKERKKERMFAENFKRKEKRN